MKQHTTEIHSLSSLFHLNCDRKNLNFSISISTPSSTSSYAPSFSYSLSSSLSAISTSDSHCMTCMYSQQNIPSNPQYLSSASSSEKQVFTISSRFSPLNPASLMRLFTSSFSMWYFLSAICNESQSLSTNMWVSVSEFSCVSKEIGKQGC